jgi:pSer/pThr/pTyr-binding forkhead associated (FHA) protein
MGMIKCPNCGHENAENTSICVCGHLLIAPSKTRVIPAEQQGESEPRFGSIRFRDTLILEVISAQKKFNFSFSQVAEIWLGRKDPETGASPTIDLEAIGAEEQGVSRRHAMISKKDGVLHLVDNNSANGTFLNEQRLIAEQPRVLRHGDDIRLGRMILRVSLY